MACAGRSPLARPIRANGGLHPTSEEADSRIGTPRPGDNCRRLVAIAHLGTGRHWRLGWSSAASNIAELLYLPRGTRERLDTRHNYRPRPPKLSRYDQYVITDLGSYALPWGVETPHETVGAHRKAPELLDRLVGEPWTYVQVPRRTKGPWNRFRAVFQLPDQGSGFGQRGRTADKTHKRSGWDGRPRRIYD